MYAHQPWSPYEHMRHTGLQVIHGSFLQAALVRFSSFTVRELGRNATYSQADVLDVAWDVDTGGSQVCRCWHMKPGYTGLAIKSCARLCARAPRACT